MNPVLVREWLGRHHAVRYGLLTTGWLGAPTFVVALALFDGWPASALVLTLWLVGVLGLAISLTWLRDPRDTSHVRCGFCGKHRSQVYRVVAGPAAHICDGCVALSAELMARETGAPAASAAPPDPNPFSPPHEA